MTKDFLITDKSGLHARPASLLVKEANKYPNTIYIEYKNNLLTLKSVMLVMSLGVKENTKISLHVEGDNAKEILAALEGVLVEHNVI